MLRVILLLAAILCLGSGGYNIYTSLTNRSPQDITAEAYYADPGHARSWLRIKGVVCYGEAVTLESRVLKMDKGTFVPLRPSEKSVPYKLLIEMSKEQLGTRIKASAATTMPAGDKSLSAILSPTETVEGVIETAFDRDSKIRPALLKNAPASGLDPAFTILKLDDTPDLLSAIGLTLFGVVATALMVWWFIATAISNRREVSVT